MNWYIVTRDDMRAIVRANDDDAAFAKYRNWYRAIVVSIDADDDATVTRDEVDIELCDCVIE